MSINSKNSGLRFQRENLKLDQNQENRRLGRENPTGGKTEPLADKNPHRQMEN